MCFDAVGGLWRGVCGCLSHTRFHMSSNGMWFTPHQTLPSINESFGKRFIGATFHHPSVSVFLCMQGLLQFHLRDFQNILETHSLVFMFRMVGGRLLGVV